MLKKLHIRTLCMCLMLLVALASNAQRGQITDRLNKNGQVNVDAPKELVKRNNANLNNKQQQTSKDKKVNEKDKNKAEPANDDEKLNELDEDTSKDVKKDEKTPFDDDPFKK